MYFTCLCLSLSLVRLSFSYFHSLSCQPVIAIDHDADVSHGPGELSLDERWQNLSQLLNRKLGDLNFRQVSFCCCCSSLNGPALPTGIRNLAFLVISFRGRPEELFKCTSIFKANFVSLSINSFLKIQISGLRMELNFYCISIIMS